MSDKVEIIESVGDSSYLVKLLKAYYEKEAVFAAVDMFRSKFHIKIDSLDSYVGVWFSKKDETDTDADVKNALLEFCNEAIDQQTKRDLNAQFGELRNIIYRYAFEPIQ